MIEKVVLDFLTAQHVSAFMEDPPGTPTMPYYIVQKTSGGESEHIGEAMIAIQSYGTTMLQAAQANEALKTLMQGLIGQTSISRCVLNSDYSFPDTARKRYRYQAVFVITHYAEGVIANA